MIFSSEGLSYAMETHKDNVDVSPRNGNGA